MTLYPTPAVSLTQHPATLSEADISNDVDHEAIASTSIQRLLSLCADSLAHNAIWRDSCALTGTLRTFYGPRVITRVWDDSAKEHRPYYFAIVPGSSRIVRAGPKVSWVEATFSFEIKGDRPARCSGVVGLIPKSTLDKDNWKIWLLCTVLEQPVGFPDVDRLVPGPPTSNAADGGKHQAGEEHIASVNGGASVGDPDTISYLDCLVVGAGIGGLCMAGRLKTLELSCIIVEKHASVGDTWKYGRYDSVKLHTSKDYSQLPGLPPTFGPEEPYHITGRGLADGFQRYAGHFRD